MVGGIIMSSDNTWIETYTGKKVNPFNPNIDQICIVDIIKDSMLHGKGIGNYSENDQSWMTDKYQKKRVKGLEDREKLSASELLTYEISGAQGGGRTITSTYEVKQFPFPVDTTIRRKKTIDIRKVDPRIGEMSD